MKQKDHEAERKIMEAAKEVFHKRGYFGARMQDIADEAGINKAMLHYYYRSKDNLFEAVFQEALGMVFGKILSSFAEKGSFEDKVRIFVDSYIDMIIQNPYIPAFVIHEINHNPERIKDFLSEKMKINPQLLIDVIKDDVKNGRIKDIDPIQIIITIISASIFPFIAKPILTRLFNLDDDKFIELMNERKKVIPEIIMNGIRK